MSGSRAFLRGRGRGGGSLGKAMGLLHIINKVLPSDPWPPQIINQQLPSAQSADHVGIRVTVL